MVKPLLLITCQVTLYPAWLPELHILQIQTKHKRGWNSTGTISSTMPLYYCEKEEEEMDKTKREEGDKEEEEKEEEVGERDGRGWGDGEEEGRKETKGEG